MRELPKEGTNIERLTTEVRRQNDVKFAITPSAVVLKTPLQQR